MIALGTAVDKIESLVAEGQTDHDLDGSSETSEIQIRKRIDTESSVETEAGTGLPASDNNETQE